MRLFDSHAHIQGSEYNGDLDEVIERARRLGVERVLLPPMTWRWRAPGLRWRSDITGLYASAGIHPHHASSVDDGVMRELELLLGEDRVVALGEIGLDYFHMHSPREAQIAAFEAQLALASKLDLPVVVHTRDAWEDTRAVIGAWAGANPFPQPPPRLRRGEAESRDAGVLPRPRGVMHYFTGSVEDGLRFIELGFLLSIHTSVTYKNAAAMREVVAQLPLESLVIETDSPYGAPQGYRGKRNEPAYVVEVAKMIAELQGVTSKRCEATMERVPAVPVAGGWRSHRGWIASATVEPVDSGAADAG